MLFIYPYAAVSSLGNTKILKNLENLFSRRVVFKTK